MAAMTLDQLEDAQQRAMLLGLIDPLADAFVASTDPLRVPRRSANGTWKNVLGNRIIFNMQQSSCGQLCIERIGLWYWHLDKPRCCRSNRNRVWESRSFNSLPGPLPKSLFEKMWFNVHTGLVSLVEASGLQVSAAGRAILFPTRQQ